MTLLVPLLISAISYLLCMTSLRSRYNIFRVIAANFLISYGLILGQTAYFEHRYDMELHRYDTNKNGMFESYEQTEGFVEAQVAVVQDTGRTFAPIFGFIISFILSALLGLALRISYYILMRLESKHEAT